MRKAQKKQAEDFLELLAQAHDEIKKSMEKNHIPAALRLLGDCQEGAVSLGTLIEQSEGEGFATVSMLEDYCERLYELHTALAEGQAVNTGKAYKTLRQSLIRIANSVRNGIRVRTEVVFLPYKASMWDSLESVWRAADADPDCDAYVIPIPYYDKNPDGSIRQMHYEGDAYPKDVPVMRYEDYDFEKRRPDRIFIHNPYDNKNFVTSVPAFFYAENLKKFTDLLVYIPYFILEEVDPKDQKAVDKIAHFVTVPGVLYADKVIVQSENMRLAYIDVLVRHTGEESRKLWEKKILGLGSPKVDKVLNTRKEDVEVPREWRPVLEKPDGNWKRIIFYNTSIAPLLEHGEKMLDKIEDVLGVFYENREDVALLWRPHPLIGATIASMRPKLWERYRKIVERYREQGWGIYDDTADMDRAVVLSDGYYGDASSMIPLCEKAGRPVMTQNCQVPEKKHFCDFLFATTAIMAGTKIWFSSNTMNALFALNLLTNSIDTVRFFPQEENKEFLFYSYAKYQNSIFFAPHSAGTMWKYDIDRDEFYGINLHLSEEEKKLGNKCRLILPYKDKLYLFGFELPGIIEYDVLHGEVRRLFEEGVIDWNGNKVPVKFTGNYEMGEDSVYLLMPDSNFIFQYFFSQNQYAIHFVDDGENKGLGTILKCEDDLIVTNVSGYEIRYSLKKKENIGSGIKLSNRMEDGFGKAFCVRDRRIYFGLFEQIIRSTHVESHHMQEFTYRYPEYELPYGYLKFGFALCLENKIIFQERCGEICIMKPDVTEIERTNIIIHGLQKRQIAKQIFKSTDMLISESDELTLSGFLMNLT